MKNWSACLTAPADADDDDADDDVDDDERRQLLHNTNYLCTAAGQLAE